MAPVVKTFRVVADSQEEANEIMRRVIENGEPVCNLYDPDDCYPTTLEQEFDQATLNMKDHNWSVAACSPPAPSFYIVDKLDTGEVRSAGSAN